MTSSDKADNHSAAGSTSETPEEYMEPKNSEHFCSVCSLSCQGATCSCLSCQPHAFRAQSSLQPELPVLATYRSC